MKGFLYRQHQRLMYHTTSDKVRRNIFELNRHRKLIEIRNDGFYIRELDFLVPRSGFDYIFNPKSFDLFISNARNLQGQYRIEDAILVFRFGDLEVETVSASELFIINEVFVQRCYDFKIPDEKIAVIDVGMNVGLASIFFACNSNVDSVYSFEPFIQTYKQAQANLARNKVLSAKIKTFNFGLGDKEQYIKVAYNVQNSGINSTAAIYTGDSTGDVADLQIREAHEVITAIVNENPTLPFVLKIDTEGAEYAILTSLFHDMLPVNIIGFMIEWHVEGATELERKLLNAGFKLLSTTLTSNSGLIYAFR